MNTVIYSSPSVGSRRSRMTWDQAVDIANIVTAVSAVVAVVVATWLGRDTIKVARSGNDDAREVFIHDQVERLLEAALALTSAAAAVSRSREAGDFEWQHEADVSAEEFNSRIDVLLALDSVHGPRDDAIRLKVFATAVYDQAMSITQLLKEGRQLSSDTLLDGNDEHTRDLLEKLVKTCQDGGTDPRHIPNAFEASPSVALALRESLVRP